MDYREFSAKIKRTHPDYADMDDLDLAQKMVKKYPNDYSDVTFDAPAGQKQPNVVQSALGLDPNASTGTQVAQVASLPFRGTRGISVAASKAVPTLMNPVRAIMNPRETVGTIGEAIQRGAEATRPGFKPEGFTENVASAVGEAGPLLPLGGPMAMGARGAALAAASGGAQSALMQKSETGEIDTATVGITAGLSGLLPGLPYLIKKAYPTIAAKLTKMGTTEAFDRLMDDPKFLQKFSGSVEAVKQRASAVFHGFQKAEDGLKKMMNNIEEYYSLKPSAGEARSAIVDSGPKTLPNIYKRLDEIKDHMVDKVTGTTYEPASGTAKKIIQKAYTGREKLMKLLDLDRDLNDITKGSLDVNTEKLKRSIGAEIKKVPGGLRMQKLRQTWSELRDIADGLTKNLTDENASPAVLEKIVRGDIRGALSAHGEKAKAAIRELEKFSGLPSVIPPLKDELLASMLQKTTSAGGRDWMERALAFMFPKAGIPLMIASSPRFAAKMVPAVRAAPRIGAQMAPVAEPLLRGEK